MSQYPPISPQKRRWLKQLVSAALASHSAFARSADVVNDNIMADSCAAADAASTAPSVKTRGMASDSPVFISAATRVSGEPLMVILTDKAQVQLTHELQSRGHGMACHQASGQIAVFSRRPGSILYAFNRACPDNVNSTSSPPNRHFYGHGAFSVEGRWLYATENDFDHARGVLGVYDTRQHYRRVGEISTAGVGPHDVLQVPKTSLLVVANGGIQTHPDKGREKLNLDTMEPSLAVIDARDGQLLARYRLPDSLHRLSIRHLAVSPEGVIWFAGQYQSDDHTSPALAGKVQLPNRFAKLGSRQVSAGLTLIELPEDLLARAQNYLTSVAISGDQVIFTSAPGGMAFSLNRHTHEVFEVIDLLDCAGVAHSGNAEGASDFLLTSGTGDVLHISDAGEFAAKINRLRWDNHLYRL